MPSLTHELFLTLFRNRPELAAELLREALGLELPRYTQVRLDSVELSQAVPTAYTADLVVLLIDDRPVLGIVLEVQLSRDDRKRMSWPVYVANLRARIGCPVELLVIAPDEAVARWAATPISLGRQSVVT